MLLSGLVVASAVASALMPSHATVAVGNPPTPRLERKAPALFTAHQVEYYLSAQQIGFIRPGLDITVLDGAVGADRRPWVELSITDAMGQPLDRLGIHTPGALAINFVLAWYEPTTREYTAYTTRRVTSPITNVTTVQAAAESGAAGTWQDLGGGRYRYTFALVLPENYPRDKTHTLGIYASRNLTEWGGRNEVENVVVDTRLDGQPVGPGETWDVMSNDACNQCHDPLQAHGGIRRDVKLCALCHSPQTIDPDTGHTMDLEVLTHKIHMGEDLPSVQAGTPYIVIGFQQSVHDYSHVAFPQDIRNCETCHHNPPPPADSATQADVWLTDPTIDGCLSCHDDVDPQTGAGHPGTFPLIGVDCSACHVPDTGHEFDVSIAGAHTVPEQSDQLPGLNVEILSITNTAPGQTPTVTFRLTDRNGATVAPSALSSFNFLVGGPTTEYQRYGRESGRGATVSGDTATYTFTQPIPADATGTWTISADAYRTVNINTGGGTLDVRDAAFNPILHFAVTDPAPVPPDMVVETSRCNRCHERLAVHGGQRMRTEQCIICHNPNETDAVVRPADQGAPTGISLEYLIHRIHTGHNLTRDFTVFGFRSIEHNYNELRYPGDLRNCEACHLPTTYDLPLPPGQINVQTPNDFFSPMPPATAACLGCHDSQDAAVHAFVNITTFGGQQVEACAACHGTGREFSVQRAHAR